MPLERHHDALARMRDRGRMRRLMPAGGHDYASNDYLGLAGSDLLRGFARDALEAGIDIGAGASRLLRGNHPAHEALEETARHFFNAEASLYFNSGFGANMAIFATLPQHGDLVLYDALIHASAHEGMRLGRAQTQSFRHNTLSDAEDHIRAWRAEGNRGQIWLAFETLYSMDGDMAPIHQIADLAARYDIVVIADEAHATGLYGAHGRGLAHGMMPNIPMICLHTCGKGLGVAGALICGPKVLMDTLVNRARAFIFATAPSPLHAAVLRDVLIYLAGDDTHILRARAQIASALVMAQDIGLPHCTESQIIPVIIGDDRKTMATAETLQAAGFDIRGIRPPTVPLNSARLRISLTLNTTNATNRAMFDTLADILKDAA